VKTWRFMKPLDDDYCLNVRLKKGITDDVKKMSVYDFADLSTRTMNCLRNAKIQTVDDLLSKSEKDLLRMKNFGRKSLNEIRTVFNLK
jgi:DNA-directed RNA polymerase subunit alpha